MISDEHLTRVILTLQYALETFEQTCQCGHCDPCTKGQADILQSIDTIYNIIEQRKG